MSKTAELIVRAAASLGILAGLWLIFSPWVWLTDYPQGATWDGFVAGLLIVPLMALKGAVPKVYWVGWAGIVIGLWILFSPWAIGFAGTEGPLYNYIITAVALIIVCAILVLTTETTANQTASSH